MSYYPNYPTYFSYSVPYQVPEFYPIYQPYVSSNVPVIVGQASGHQVQHHNPYTRYETEKFGYNSRKDSQDSGIYDSSNPSSRKTSNSSTVSATTISEEPGLEDVLEEGPFEEPDDELATQISSQVEFYFSDPNITKDKFLLKHVKRNKDGFVSLKLISSFKRVKQLTKNWKQVAYAVELKSTKLEVNELKNKVRRIDPLPEYDLTTPNRTVIAVDVPLERPTIEAVAELFSSCGEITLVRILRPGNPVPADVRPFISKHPEMTTKVCALVEFESADFAQAAIELLNNKEEGKMKVIELSCPEKRKVGLSNLPSPMSIPQRRFSHGMAPTQMKYNQNILADPRRKISLSNNMKFSTNLEHQAKSKTNLNPNAPVFTMQQRRTSRPILINGNALVMEHLSRNGQPETSLRGSRRSVGDLGCAASGLTLPVNVIRQPKGPDNSGGFLPNWRNPAVEAESSLTVQDCVTVEENLQESDIEESQSIESDEGEEVDENQDFDVANIVEGPFAEDIKSFRASFISKGNERMR